MIKVKNYTVNVPHVHILLTGFKEGLKVEESEITGTHNFFFLRGPKLEFAHITKRSINPYYFFTLGREINSSKCANF